ncbi:MAG: DNA replication/repair protein RecF [Sedimenticola sp.]
MAITSLRISNLRNIEETELNPDVGNNLIWGSNGSGKTSLLEAIYLLARGRSFRSSKAGPLIRNGSDNLFVYSQYQRSNAAFRIGLSKSRSSTEVKINGDRISKLSDLASLIPLHIITPQSHQLLERGPEYRRRFLDWGVFHVEHTHNLLIRRYLRVLNQRNAALRQDQGQARIWDDELVKAGSQLNEQRERYLTHLKDALDLELDRFLPQYGGSFEWRSGWDREKGFKATLDETFQSDCKRCFTQAGPQRADLVIRLDNHKASEVASRGQQKLLIAALKIAQIRVTRTMSQIDQVLLIDDLAAELDQENLGKIFERIKELSVQSFMTATDKRLFSDFSMDGMFHVEHGKISS